MKNDDIIFFLNYVLINIHVYFSLGIFIILHFWGPEGQIVSYKLHDGGRVLVLVIINVFNISDGIIEGGFSQIAGFSGVVQSFVMENWKVKSQSESNGVGGFQFSVSNFGSSRIGFQGSVLDLFVLVTSGVFRDISEVISFHFQVEYFRFRVIGFGDQVGVQKVKNILAESL